MIYIKYKIVKYEIFLIPMLLCRYMFYIFINNKICNFFYEIEDIAAEYMMWNLAFTLLSFKYTIKHASFVPS